MTEAQTLLVHRQDEVEVITLNRPDVLNAISGEMRRALRDALQAAAEDAAVRVVVLTGSGRAFSAGADLREERPSADDTRTLLLEEYGPGLRSITEMPKPVIAALNGPAVGIGLAYALVSDLLVMARSAYLQAPFGNIGLLPDGGLSWLLPRALGYARAYQFVAESEQLSAERCLALGLVNRVVPDGQVVSEAMTWARSLCARAPLALAAAKAAMRQSLSSSYPQSLETEASLQGPLVQSADCAEGFTAFIEQRPPKFTGR